MWSCLSGRAGSSWPALEVQSMPVWDISRSGENLIALISLLCVALNFSWLTWCYVVCAGSRLWQKHCYEYANSCRKCETRTTNTTVLMPPTSVLPWQRSRNLHHPCSQSLLQSETFYHITNLWLLCTAHDIHTDQDKLFHVVDMFCCDLALQRSSGWETTYHVEFTTAASRTEDRGAIHSGREVRLHLTDCHNYCIYVQSVCSLCLIQALLLHWVVKYELWRYEELTARHRSSTTTQNQEPGFTVGALNPQSSFMKCCF